MNHVPGCGLAVLDHVIYQPHVSLISSFLMMTRAFWSKRHVHFEFNCRESYLVIWELVERGS